MEALQSLYLWRDRIARQQDESTGLVVFIFESLDTLPAIVGELSVFGLLCLFVCLFVALAT